MGSMRLDEVRENMSKDRLNCPAVTRNPGWEPRSQEQVPGLGTSIRELDGRDAVEHLVEAGGGPKAGPAEEELGSGLSIHRGRVELGVGPGRR